MTFTITVTPVDDVPSSSWPGIRRSSKTPVRDDPGVRHCYQPGPGDGAGQGLAFFVSTATNGSCAVLHDRPQRTSNLSHSSPGREQDSDRDMTLADDGARRSTPATIVRSEAKKIFTIASHRSNDLSTFLPRGWPVVHQRERGPATVLDLLTGFVPATANQCHTEASMRSPWWSAQRTAARVHPMPPTIRPYVRARSGVRPGRMAPSRTAPFVRVHERTASNRAIRLPVVFALTVTPPAPMAGPIPESDPVSDPDAIPTRVPRPTAAPDVAPDAACHDDHQQVGDRSAGGV